MPRLQLTRAFIMGTLVAILIGIGSFQAFSPLQPTPVLADEPEPAALLIYLPLVNGRSEGRTITYTLTDTHTLFAYGDSPAEAQAAEGFEMWGPDLTLGYYKTQERLPHPMSPQFLLARSRFYVTIPEGIQPNASGSLSLARQRVSGEGIPGSESVLVELWRCPAQRPTETSDVWDDADMKLGEAITLAAPAVMAVEVSLNLAGVSLNPGEELCLEARGSEDFGRSLELGYSGPTSRLTIRHLP